MNQPPRDSQPPTPPPAGSLKHRRDALLHEIPPATARAFWGYRQARLAAAQQQADALAGDTAIGGADPYQVERHLLETLIRECEGRDDPDGLGDVPETADKIVGIVVPLSDPRQQGPRPRTATTSTDTSALSPQRRGAIAAVLLATLLVGVWWRWSSHAPAHGDTQAGASPRPSASVSARPVSASPLAEVAGDGVQLADPISVEFRGDTPTSPTTIYTVVPHRSDGTRGPPVVERGTADWWQGSYLNAGFCLPDEAQPLISTARRGQTILVRLANSAVRRYEVVRTRRIGRQQTEIMDQGHAGMTLWQCGSPTNERTIIEAIYRPNVIARTRHGMQEKVALADLASVEVMNVHSISSTDTVPPGMMPIEVEVDVTNRSTTPLAWSDVVDQLDMGGQQAERVVAEDWRALDANEQRTVRYRYLVPDTGGQATWRVTAATGDSQAVQLRIPSRSEATGSRLVASLNAADVRVVPGTTGRPQVEVTLYLTAQGIEPSTLAPDALSVRNATTLAPLAFTTVTTPEVVAPGVAQPVTLLADPPPTGTALVVQVGEQRWQVEVLK